MALQPSVQIAERFWREVWQLRNPDAADHLVSEDFIVTSGGRSGGTHVQPPLVEILGLLGNTMVTEPAIMVVTGADRIASDGTTTDPEIESLVRARLDGIVTALTQRS